MGVVAAWPNYKRSEHIKIKGAYVCGLNWQKKIIEDWQKNINRELSGTNESGTSWLIGDGSSGWRCQSAISNSEKQVFPNTLTPNSTTSLF